MLWKRRRIGIALLLLGVQACMASVHASPAASSKPSDAQHAAAIHTEDVYRFYKIYAAHDGHPRLNNSSTTTSTPVRKGCIASLS